MFSHLSELTVGCFTCAVSVMLSQWSFRWDCYPLQLRGHRHQGTGQLLPMPRSIIGKRVGPGLPLKSLSKEPLSYTSSWNQRGAGLGSLESFFFFFFCTLKTLKGQRSFVEPSSDMTVSLKPEKRVFENAPSPSLALNVIKIKPQTKRKNNEESRGCLCGFVPNSQTSLG